MSDVGDDLDPQRELTELLTRLADDPDAPPSSVSALSVIAAARAEARSAATDATGAWTGDKPPAPSTGAASGRNRPGRRRLFIGGLVAAASLAAIAAVVVPVTISGNSSNTSADSARVATAANPPAAEQSAAAAAPAPTIAGSASGAGTAGEQEAGGAADTAADASTASAAAGGGCWSELSEAASDALSAALTPGEFASPVPLTADCGPAPVAGAVLAGTEPGTVLVVRVSAAEPGSCLVDVADPCALQSGDVYLAVDATGADTAFVYGNGFEVAAGGWPAVGDSVAIGSGLTTDELVAAAQAVLGTLE